MKAQLLKTVKNVKSAVDYYTGRYQCTIATGSALEECYAIRKKVFGDELKRARSKVGAVVAMEDEFDKHSVQVMCTDTRTGKVVGCIRNTPAEAFLKSPDHMKEYHLDVFDRLTLKRVCVPSRLAVLPEHRGAGLVSLALVGKLYDLAFDPYWVACMVCEPNLYPLYRRLGYRPLGRVQTSPFGGYRLPLYLVLHDYQHLERVESPFLKVAKEKGSTSVVGGKEWLLRFSEKNGSTDPGFSAVSPSEVGAYESFITEGMSSAGKKEVLEGAIHIRCQYGDQVIAESDGGRNIGLVQKGAVEVHRGNRLKAILGEGDTFGELAFLLKIPRTATITAGTDGTEVIFLSLSVVNSLKKADDRIAFWRNLCTLLARKVAAYRVGSGYDR